MIYDKDLASPGKGTKHLAVSLNAFVYSMKPVFMEMKRRKLHPFLAGFQPRSFLHGGALSSER